MQNHEEESKRVHQEIQPRDHTSHDHDIKQFDKVRSMQKLGQDRLITLLDKLDKEIHDQDKIIERTQKLYTDIYTIVNRVA